MSKVFVLDANKQPLSPVHPGRARLLLKEGKASVYRSAPFTIILKRRVEHPAPAPLRLKIDPGANITGLALVDDARGEVVWAAELSHRGAAIKKALDTRRAVRRGRRSRRTRYRAPRWANRRRKANWLPPSLYSRVHNILTWIMRIRRVAHVTALSQELVRFDLQKIESPEIAGVQYQQGTLFGYEVREYVLEKWNHRCAYCGTIGVPLQLEHVQSRARGGSNSVSNLTLACEPCNRAKGTQDIRDFLAHDPSRLAYILAQVKTPLKDATAVNATRWALFEQLKATGLPVELGSGGLTKYNRAKLALPKTHWLDAAAVGTSTPEQLHMDGVVPLLISATGRGHRRLCNINALGFPVSHRKRHKRYFGFQTGDIVRAVIPERFASRGTHVGRVAVRARGTFDITTRHGRVTDVPYRFCRLIGRNDGYRYQTGWSIPSQQECPNSQARSLWVIGRSNL
ncbi:MAG TPA: RNA-guided endonuclease IscB [Ktedonobacteraceae bacterium]|nr:RNA-guided endonuclease IscB [Ktedonobacteraceae bacterium]